MLLKERKETLSNIRLLCLRDCDQITEVALWCTNKIIDSPNNVAATNGRSVYFYDQFFDNYTFKEQCFIYVHEIFHVIFRHGSRGKAVCNTLNDRSLFNIAADCIINEVLQKIHWVSIPKNACTFKSLNVHLTKKYHEYSVESLFLELKSINESTNKQLSIDLEDLLSERECNTGEVLSCEGFSEDEVNESELEIVTSQAIKKLFSGASGSNFLGLEKDIPKCRTPWDKILNNFLQRVLSQKTYSNWSYPSRLTTSGSVQVFLPATHKRRELKTIYVCLDVSGSCFDKKTLKLFASNILSIQKKTGSQLKILTFDTQVQQRCVLTKPEEFTKVYEGLTGGGGTSFVPLFDSEELKESPTVMVILTDGWGSFPVTRPSFPVLWALNHDEQLEVPFGKTIRLT